MVWYLADDYGSGVVVYLPYLFQVRQVGSLGQDGEGEAEDQQPESAFEVDDYESGVSTVWTTVVVWYLRHPRLLYYCIIPYSLQRKGVVPNTRTDDTTETRSPGRRTSPANTSPVQKV